jgi:hypothetical protein
MKGGDKMLERKTFMLPAELVKALKDYQFENRHNSLTEAVISLLQIALKKAP